MQKKEKDRKSNNSKSASQSSKTRNVTINRTKINPVERKLIRNIVE